MPSASPYDLIVVGGGPAGEKAAAQAAYFGKRVALVDRLPLLGGTMVDGAVSSKTMREAALYLTGFGSREAYGIGLDLPAAAAMARLRSRTDHIVEMMAQTAQANMARHDVDVLRGHARIGAGRTVEIRSDHEPPRTIEARIILLAPGSRPFHPPGVPFDDPDVLDPDAAARLDAPLRSVTVVGGGAVGCEFASIFLALGAEVSLVDSGPRLLPFMDEEISDLLAHTFRAAGMRVIHDAGRATVERADGSLAVVLSSGERLPSEKVIFATGREGNTHDLFLDDADIELDDRGRIVVDEHFMTSAEGVYAAGDAIGPPALASVSMEQARIAICWAFDLPLKRAVDHLAPFGVYSIPEVAMVGLTQAAARAAGEACEVGRTTFAQNTRATIAGTPAGMLKLVFRRDDLRLLGVHALGASATELVHQGQAVMHFGGTIEYFVQTAFNAPTLSEVYKYAAYDGLGRLAGRAKPS